MNPKTGSQQRTLKPGVRMGTSLRGSLARDYDARGSGNSNLVLTYSPKSNKDVVLKSRIEYHNFLRCEANPEIEFVEYGLNCWGMLQENELTEIRISAIATLTSGEKKAFVVGYEKKPTLVGKMCFMTNTITTGIPLVSICSDEIFENPMLIQNWNRIIPWMTQIYHTPVAMYLAPIVAAAKSGEITMWDILSMGSQNEQAFYAGAAFKAVQTGLLSSDLDSRPLSLKSVFRAW